MNSEEHRRLRTLLGAFALGQLNPSDALAVQAHLDGCPGCRAELDSIAPLAASLRLVDPDRLQLAPASPPPWLEKSILTAIDSEPRSMVRARRWLLSAAAALVVAGAGAGVGYSAAPDPPRIPLEPVPVTVVAAGVQSTADVVPHTWGMEIKLTATGFDTGRRYRVVVVDDTGRVAPAGEFIGTGSSQMHCNLNSSVLRADATQFQVIADNGRIVASARI